jgi:hypothetical protein
MEGNEVRVEVVNWYDHGMSRKITDIEGVMFKKRSPDQASSCVPMCHLHRFLKQDNKQTDSSYRELTSARLFRTVCSISFSDNATPSSPPPPMTRLGWLLS